MKDLWMQARKYGLLRVVTSDDGTYYAHLEFNSPKHTTIKVSSGFNHVDPEDALRKLIANAKEAVQLTLSLEIPK